MVNSCNGFEDTVLVSLNYSSAQCIIKGVATIEATEATASVKFQPYIA